MKKILGTAAVLAVLMSCGGGDNNKNTTETKKDATTDLSQNPDYQKGLELVGKSGCLTCHKIDEKLTGPAYRDVANKYASYPDTIVQHLAKKILSGGSGVWGEVPMIPHPALTLEEAEAMVKYILLLKK
jgi:cytochrome c